MVILKMRRERRQDCRTKSCDKLYGDCGELLAQARITTREHHG
jgi:hypothetical protein